ncbi:hypothetical protein [Verrucosispora sp. FIM060022]|uniref:hypothetical protein n=1 Tax=Verrucosispora sp. FIM060022 TaxID=1479020 RepID=UPI00256F111B|nr:hypothetical protein [Verrucosispora sp. FIM060022]
MRHVLDDPSGLSPRVSRFLRHAAERTSFDVSNGPATDELRSLLSQMPGVDVQATLTLFRRAAARYGGLRYRSVAWSFEETVTFVPIPWAADDYGIEDQDAMADLIAHDVAHPYAVWLRGDGAVVYCFTGPHSAPVVPVFPGIDAMLEAEALYQECATWIPVSLDDAPGMAAVEAHAAHLTPIPEACGYTERWWEQDGFRLHIWKTFATVFPGSGAAQWAMWARNRSGEMAARSFLTQART